MRYFHHDSHLKDGCCHLTCKWILPFLSPSCLTEPHLAMDTSIHSTTDPSGFKSDLCMMNQSGKRNTSEELSPTISPKQPICRYKLPIESISSHLSWPICDQQNEWHQIWLLSNSATQHTERSFCPINWI